jgi:RimJ/RimL family protein N-acetyltransferase
VTILKCLDSAALHQGYEPTKLTKMTDDELIEKLKAAPREMHTPRTVLRAPSLDQIPVRMSWAVASSASLDFVARWRKSADVEVATRSAHSEMRAVEAGEELIYNVFEKDTNAYVGRIDLHSWDADAPRCEIGYMADAPTSGRGLLREAAAACVQLAFDIGAVRIQVITDTRNTRSIQFAEALGMQHEGVLRSYEQLDGVVCDQALLSIVRPARPR